MRKIFGGSVLLSLVGAIILGGSLAWESTQHSDGNKASVGELEWGMFYVDKPCLDYGNGEEPPELRRSCQADKIDFVGRQQPPPGKGNDQQEGQGEAYMTQHLEHC